MGEQCDLERAAKCLHYCEGINPEAVPELVKSVKAIQKGEGRFSRDNLQHASNPIQDMKMLAGKALALAEKTDG